MKIILPKTLVLEERDYPLFFLAGPIRGGGDWQHKMCLALKERMRREFLVAVPCRYTNEHPLYPFAVSGTEDTFPRQLLWERHHLEVAGFRDKDGCIIFWLPEEDTINPRKKEDEPYARDTYGELGRWGGHMRHRSCNVIVGAEEGFPGLSQISRNFGEDCRDHFPILGSIEETADAAVKHISRNDAS